MSIILINLIFLINNDNIHTGTRVTYLSYNTATLISYTNYQRKHCIFSISNVAQKILSFVSTPFYTLNMINQSFYIYAGMTRTYTNNMIIYNLHPPKAHKHTHVTCTHTEKVRQEQKLFTVSLMGKSLEVDSCMELFL